VDKSAYETGDSMLKQVTRQRSMAYRPNFCDYWRL